MNKILYAKCSNERAEKFSLKTLIWADEDGKRHVEKRPDTKKAEEHVDQIAHWYQKLSEQYQTSFIFPNVCKKTEQGVGLEYVSGDTLEQYLDRCIEEDNKEEFQRILFRYLEEIKGVHKKETFYQTDKFREIFGEAEIPEEEWCGEVTNVDALFANIVLQTPEAWCLLDYEWTFDFPIPVKYLLYRIWFYYIHEHEMRKKAELWVPWEMLEISEKDREIFEQMEKAFQRYIQGSRIPIRDMYQTISPGSTSLSEMCYLGSEQLKKRKVQIYHTDKTEIAESDSVFLSMDRENRFVYSLEVIPEVQYLRIDPCSKSCLVKGLEISCGETPCAYDTNGVSVGDACLYYATEDPWILIREPQQYSKKKIRISFEVEFLEAAASVLLECLVKERQQAVQRKAEMDQLCQNYEQELAQKSEQLQQKEQLIADMRHTKVWKAYEKYKSFTEK